MSDFQQFGLLEPIVKAVAEEGYTQPTPIQLKAIPDVVQGRDLLGIAQTGTGKTAAFALPILHRLASAPKAPGRRQCRCLVLSPTRELASQIADSFRTYGRHLRLTSTVIFGGVPLGKQERALAGGVDVLVATPGRLLDLIDRGALSLGAIEILVLDEADQMLDLGFIHALRRIVTMVPKQRQSLFFSATMPNMIAGLANQLLRDPVQVSVTPVATTAERVQQSVIFASTNDKQEMLRAVLTQPDIERVLVFTRTKHGADRVVRALERDGITSAAIHGNKSQGQRERALGDFRAGRCNILVATDIAARGIDVEGVSHVVNFDLPNVPESYVHRIGRTARAGAAGVAVSFCNGEERAYLKDIEKLTRMRVPVAEAPEGFRPGLKPAPDTREQSERPAGGRPSNGRPGNRGGRPAHAGGGGRHGHDGQPAGQNNPRRHGGGGGQSQPAHQPQAAKPRHLGAKPPGAKPAGAKPAAAQPRRDGGGRAGQGTGRPEGQLAWLDRSRRP